MAALVAAGVLVVAVLPAEYGIDLLGAGKVLGLTAISRPTATEAVPTAASAAFTPVQDGPVAHFAAEYKTDSLQLTIAPYQFLEYKYRLEKGATMLYAWTASGEVRSELHADPDGDPKPEPVSFDRKPARGANGSLTAPFAGIHGWFWENLGGEPITISLTTAGFYSAATEFRSNRTRVAHELMPAPRPASQ